jgi:hypothetical protein
MSKIQRLLLTILGIALLAATAVLVAQNWQTGVPAQWFSWHDRPLSLGSLMGMAALLFGGGALLLMWVQVLSLNKEYRKTSRELERKDVSREEAEEKVKVLENKIITLEKALSEALKLSR